jgi:hypothetical protein
MSVWLKFGWTKLGMFNLSFFQNFPTYGFYGGIDLSFNNPENKSNFYKNISRTMAEDTFGDTFKGNEYYNIRGYLGGLIPLNNMIIVGAGLSWNEKQTLRKYYDSTHILGDSGNYIILDSKINGFGLNLAILLEITKELGAYYLFDSWETTHTFGLNYCYKY